MANPPCINRCTLLSHIHRTTQYCGCQSPSTRAWIKKSPAPAEANTGDQRLDGIIEIYHQLNEEGKDALANRAEEMTYIPKYKKCASLSEEKTEVS